MARSWKGFGALALGAIVSGILGSGAADAKTEPTPPAAPIALANASSTAAVAPPVSGGGYAV